MKPDNPYTANTMSDAAEGAASPQRRRRSLTGAVAFALSVCSLILVIGMEVLDAVFTPPNPLVHGTYPFMALGAIACWSVSAIAALASLDNGLSRLSLPLNGVTFVFAIVTL